MTYTRWGRSHCPYTSSIVYSGTMAGTSWHYEGGGSNFLCMPFNPDYLSVRNGEQNQSPLEGAEYAQPLRKSSAELNAPCTVCSVASRNQVLMIPGKIYCPSSWTREYYGYLMSEGKHTHRSSFACIDIAQEGIPGSWGHTSASDLWHVEARCNGVPCPPYDPQKEITCVVCTKWCSSAKRQTKLYM